jgi:uncharacterized membrane protein YqjE
VSDYISPDEELAPEPGERAARPSLMDSAKRMLSTLIALVHTRLELFTTEIEEEIQRAASVLLWALVALFFGSLFFMMIGFTIIVAFWDDHRLLATSCVTGAYLLGTVVFGLMARARLRAKPRFMAASIDELKRDRESLDRMTS